MINFDKDKKLSLSERESIVIRNMDGITDPSQISTILKDLFAVRIEDLLSPADYKATLDSVKTVSKDCGIHLKERGITFLDMLVLTQIQFADDLNNMDYFNYYGVYEKQDVLTMSTVFFYRFLCYAAFRHPSGAGGKPLKDFMKIRFQALQDYFRDNYGLQISTLFSRKLRKEHPIDKVILEDILSDLRDNIERKWIPCLSLNGYVHDIRSAYKQFADVFYFPLSAVFEKDYLPEDCTEQDYLTKNYLQKGCDDNA